MSRGSRTAQRIVCVNSEFCSEGRAKDTAEGQCQKDSVPKTGNRDLFTCSEK